MFTTLLTNLQSLISKGFLVASFLPVLAFGFANAVMMYCLYAPFHDYVVANADLSAGLASLIVAASLIGLAFLAYIEAAFLPTIQSWFEGNWPGWIAYFLRPFFTPSQMNRYDRLVREEEESRLLYGSLSSTSDSGRVREGWRKRLATAKEQVGQQRLVDYSAHAPSARTVQALHGLLQQGRLPTDYEIEAAVNALSTDLARTDLPPPPVRVFDFVEAWLLEAIAAADDRASQCENEKTRLQAQITDARRVGSDVEVNDYRKKTHASASTVEKLADLRRSAQPISLAQLQEAVGVLAPDLRANNADLVRDNRDLEDVRALLWQLIDYADEYATAQYRSRSITLNFEYGSLPLAPTRMGNVAKTVQNYAVNRYKFNFELLWSRLQVYAQKDQNFGGTLQAAKTQLDFLISCSALTLLWALPWTAWLGVTGGPALLFLAVALGGPLLSWIFYCAAVAQYRTLADLLRSSVDLFRFDLLGGLHYPPPGSVLEETDLWELIDGLHSRYELADLRYVPGKPS